MTVGIGLAAILLPSIVSGYLLLNTKYAIVCWPERPGSNKYFRILLVGWIWWLIWWTVLALVGKPIFAKIIKLEWLAYSLIENKFLLAGFVATIAAIVLRVVLERFSAEYFIRRTGGYDEGLYGHIEDDRHMLYLHTLKSLQRSMEAFILSSMKDKSGNPQLVMLTMESGEIYIGFARLLPTKDETKWIELMLVASGYRNQKDKTMDITASYFDLEENIESGGFFTNRTLTEQEGEDLKNMEMILPVSQIVAFQRFNVNLHEQVQAIKGEESK